MTVGELRQRLRGLPAGLEVVVHVDVDEDECLALEALGAWQIKPPGRRPFVRIAATYEAPFETGPDDEAADAAPLTTD
jgi:hypothetical protein